jgi:hypothetical protein
MYIIRYSIDGFKPQYQFYHLDGVNYELNEFNIFDYPLHLRTIILEQHKKRIMFYKEHYNDFKQGIWVFIEGYKDNQSLNHLKQRVPCWKAYIDDNAICYDCNWGKQVTVSDSYIHFGGCYIPESQLSTLKVLGIVYGKQETYWNKLHA